MSAPDKPSLLDKLRAQSAALQQQEGARRRPAEEALQDIDRRLWKAFRWFEEALHHLEVIKPAVAHSFRLDPLLAIEAPRFDRGFVSYRRRAIAGLELLEHVEIFYRLTGGDEIVFKLPPGTARGVEDRLRAANLQYRYQTEMDQNRVVRNGVFTVTPEITASIRFAPDYRTQTVEVTLRNVDRFESVSLEFRADAIEEAVFEDLFRFISGEANTFLRRAPLTGVGPARHVVAAKPAATIAPVSVKGR
jgi:hypothetical protein